MNAKREFPVEKEVDAALFFRFLRTKLSNSGQGWDRSGRLSAENHASVIHPIYGVVLRALDYVYPGLEG
jgi:hypothetical protein